MAIFAHHQTAGKGQRGRAWLGEKGENIALSLVVKPAPLPVSAQFRLSVCVAAAAHAFFSQYAGDECSIKWPNDLYWKDRKAGGILIENVIHGGSTNMAGWDWAVIGIGMNINQRRFAADAKNAVSLRQITGKPVDVISLASQLAATVLDRVNTLQQGRYDELHAYYLYHFYKKEQVVKLRSGSRIFDATIKGITPEGKLLVFHRFEEEFAVGEVEWILS